MTRVGVVLGQAAPAPDLRESLRLAVAWLAAGASVEVIELGAPLGEAPDSWLNRTRLGELLDDAGALVAALDEGATWHERVDAHAVRTALAPCDHVLRLGVLGTDERATPLALDAALLSANPHDLVTRLRSAGQIYRVR